MTLFLARFIVIVTLGLTAIAANANTFNVHELYKGTFTETDLGGGNFSSTHSLNFDSLFPGSDSLSSVSQSLTGNGTYFYSTDANLIKRSNNGSFTQTLANGDMLFGFVGEDFSGAVAGYSVKPRPSLADGFPLYDYSGTYIFTGGTGLFSGASGFGFYNGRDTFLTNSSGTTELGFEYTITTLDVPPTATPLPAAAWLFGSGIMGLLGLRRKALA